MRRARAAADGCCRGRARRRRRRARRESTSWRRERASSDVCVHKERKGVGNRKGGGLMIRRLALLLLTGIAVVGTAVAGYSFAGVTSPAKHTDTQVTVHAGEYYFLLSQTSVPVGSVTFTVINDGDVTHDFSIAGQTTTTLSS